MYTFTFYIFKCQSGVISILFLGKLEASFDTIVKHVPIVIYTQISDIVFHEKI